MPRITPATRIAITLGFISATLVWIAHGLGLMPSPHAHVHERRLAIVQTLAGSISGIASTGKGNRSALQRSLDLTTRLNNDVLSVGVRGKSRYLAKSEDHEANWKSTESEGQSNQAELEVFANKRFWGTLEVRFADKSSVGLLGFMYPLSIVAFVSLLTTVFSWWVLNRSFRYLNPSKVVPKRVRSAFDTLTEGLVLIDGDFEVAHANKAFGEILNVETDADSLIGKSLNELGWKTQNDNGDSKELPWLQCISKEASVTGEILEIGEGADRRKFFVNSAPIFGNESECRGAMISFDDVTEMERKKLELAALVKTLRSSRDEVERQNEQLTFLASYDTLTECMNRRAFWIEFEQMWTDAEPAELSLLMIDVDNFKSFNDTYGHSFGDLVLQSLGKTLRDIVPDVGVVSRFGGEEFVVALANMTLDEALELTHTIHKAIRDIDVEGKNVTASIGFSNREFKAMDGQHMLDQADVSLYAAKRGGRNCVKRFDECEPSDGLALDNESADAHQSAQQVEIPVAAVEGFLKAVEHRCKATADHSRRVARLCAGIGKSFLKPDEVYRLEVAAQLHEIGKLGVPDSILNKSKQLSTDDWQVVCQQKQIGLQLVKSAFTDSAVPQIIEANQHIEGQPKTAQDHTDGGELTGGEALETSAAILAVCDEFDSLIHGSDTRAGLQIEDAIARIKDDASMRFRADIVSKFVEHIEKYGAERQLSRSGGMGENWPPKLHTAIDVSAAKEIESAGMELSSSSIGESFEAEVSVETSLDQEISSTMKLANELLGLRDEVRTVANTEEPKVDDQEKSTESS